MATCKGWTKKGSLEKKFEWCPPGRRRKGRPGNSWMQEVTTGMRERERVGNKQLGMGRQRRVEKKNKIKH